jgi:hypothetical protein
VLAHYFGERFMRRLPATPRAPAAAMVAAREDTRTAGVPRSLDRE